MAHRRRWPWILAGIAATVILTIVALLLLSARLSPPPPEPSQPVELREIPAAWLAPEPLSPPQTQGRSEAEPNDPDGERTFTGTLVFTSGGRPFGQETYTLRVSERGGIRLETSGVFSFKVLFATVRITFEQALQAKRNGQLVSYTLETKGPLGFGNQAIETRVENETAVIAQGDETRRVPIVPERTFVLGTFSTYAILPILLAGHGDAPTTYEILMFGGPPGARRDEEGSGALPEMTVTGASTALLRIEDRELRAERYEIRSEMGPSSLLARDDEFLGLLAEGPDADLLVYRSDFLPNGIDLVEPIPP